MTTEATSSERILCALTERECTAGVRRAAAAVLLAGLLITGIRAAEGQQPPRVGSRPDIIVFMVDTLRARELACYGSPIVKSPEIDRFAGESTLFLRASAPAGSTRPSIASLITGVPPAVHGVRNLRDRLPDGRRSSLARIPTILRDAGYHTAGVVANPNVDALFGFSEGFDLYRGLYAPRKDHRPAVAGDLVTDARRMVDAVRDVIESAPQDRPLFLFVLVIDPHAPYTPPVRHARLYDAELDPRRAGSMAAIQIFDRRVAEGKQVSADRFMALYRGEVSFVDEQFGGLVAYLRKTGRLDRTLLVLTADHGEEFLEHGRRGHGHSVYEETSHVPLLLRQSGVFVRGARRDEEVDLTDLSTTLALAAGAEPPSYWGGRDLRSAHLDPRPIVTSTVDKWRRYDGVRHDGYKLIKDFSGGSLTLYRLSDDPHETRPLTGEEVLQVQRRLAALLDAFEERAAATRTALGLGGDSAGDEPVPEELLEKLRSLGYAD